MVKTTSQKVELQNDDYKNLMDSIYDKSLKLSYSALKNFALSPRHFIKYKLRKFVQTDAMKAGQLLDCLITTPDKFDTDYVVSDASRPTGKGGIMCDALLIGAPMSEALNHAGYTNKPTAKSLDAIMGFVEFQKANEGKIIISESEYDFAKSKEKALLKNEASRWIIDQITETQIKCEWERYNYRWHGYADMQGEHIMCDLKSMGADASPRKVKYTIRDMKYNWQASMYTDSQQKKRDYYIMAIDNNLNITVMQIDKHSLYEAREEIDEAMVRFKKCMFKNAWSESYNFNTPSGIYNYNEF